MKTTLLASSVKWIAVLVLMAGSFGYGYLCNSRRLPGYSHVRQLHIWAVQQPTLRKAYSFVTRRGGEADIAAWQVVGDRTRERVDALAKLQTLPYLSGYEAAPTYTHVTIHVDSLISPGFNLYTSGHAPQAILMNTQGKVVHHWSYDFASALPNEPIRKGPKSWDWWSRVHLDENGDLVAIYDGYGLIKVDRNSKLIWATPGTFHHDLFVDNNGTIYCLTRETKVLPRIHEFESIVEDFITIVDSTGNMVRQVSLLEAVERSSFVSLVNSMPEHGDLLHTNSIEVLDGSHAERSSIFKDGNVLVSFATIDMIAIVDLEKEQVVWALTGQWDRQHHPTFLDNGHILLLDNLGRHGKSKVIEMDPLSQEIVWAYEGTSENEFFTRSFGTNQRLRNGNTLINESNSGRALEVAPDKRIVWEFLNPARAGANKELIATLFDFQRVESDFVSGWLHETIGDEFGSR